MTKRVTVVEVGPRDGLQNEQVVVATADKIELATPGELSAGIAPEQDAFATGWGRVTSEGVLLPLCLSHRMLGELVGARRPSVSTAAAALEKADRLIRRPDGTWLVREHTAVARTAPQSVAQRRRLVPS